MKSTLDRLSAKEKEALALLYNTEGYEVLRKLCTLEVEEFAKDALIAPNMEVLNYYRGQADFAKNLPKAIRKVYKEVNKES